MADSSVRERLDAPQDPVGAVLAFFAILALAGFALGWLTQSLGAF